MHSVRVSDTSVFAYASRSGVAYGSSYVVPSVSGSKQNYDLVMMQMSFSLVVGVGV